MLNGQKWRIWRLKLVFWLAYRVFRVPIDVKAHYLTDRIFS